MFSDEKRGHPTSTFMQSRLPVMTGNKRLSTQALIEAKDNDENDISVIENSWGTLTLRGKRLSQIHRDVMDWIFTFHKTKTDNGDGSFTFSFNPYALLKDLGVKNPHMEQFVKWLDEMKSANIKIETKKFVSHTVIVTEHGYQKTGKSTYKFGDGENYEVVFSRKFMQFFEQDGNVYYNKLLLPLLKIKDANLKAIARWFFTHKQMHKELEQVLLLLDIIQETQTRSYKNRIIRDIRQSIHEVRSHKEKGKDGKEVEYRIFDEFGIFLDKNDMFHYTQHKSIWISPVDKLK